MPDNRTGEIQTSLADHEVRASHADLKESAKDCLEIRQVSTVWQFGNWDETPTELPSTLFVLPLHLGQKVYYQNGYAGKIVSLRIDHQSEIINFVVQSDHLLSRRRVVPFQWVDRIEAGRLYLSATQDEFKSLPDERPDSKLVSEVELALWDDGILHGIEYPRMDISARCGVIVLEGFVPYLGLKTRVEDIVHSVPGVLGIINDLVSDLDLKIAALTAVTRDPYDHEDRIFIVSHNGFIHLSGEVSSMEARLAAEVRAGNVPQIRGVLNSLRVPGSQVAFKEQIALQPRIGAIVHTREGELGVIQQVIINPINRLVVAMIVNGQFSDPKEKKKSFLSNKRALAQHTIVIPIEAVAQESVTAVSLEISGREASRFENFNPQFITVPDADWQPPYPYHSEQVLIQKTSPGDQSAVFSQDLDE